MAKLYLRRRVSFAAAHAYWIANKSEAENRALFGKWASRWGHGHNYIVEAVVAGELAPETGMVVNITEVDAVLKEFIVARLADKHLTYEVPEFADTPPTLENIARFVARQFTSHFNHPNAYLDRVTVWEMPTLWATLYTGKEKAMFTVTRSLDFAAAHRLHALGLSDERNREIFGKCNNPRGHGHNYGIEVTVTGDLDPTTGMLVDLAQLDAVMEREIVQRFDHKHLNDDTEEFRSLNPTSENLTRVIWDHLEPNIPAPARLYRVVVRETERNYFEYYGSGSPVEG